MSKGRTKGSQRKTLEERIEARYEDETYKAGSAYQVREELDRLAGKVRNLGLTNSGHFLALNDVIALIREAKK